MAITSTGYSLKRYEDIISEVRNDLIVASGNPNLDLSDDSLLGVLNSIWCLKYAELYELAQAQWSAGDIDTAEGIALDRIVARGRVRRQLPVFASGTLEFSGSLNTIINAGTQVKDLAGNVVATTQQITLNLNNIRAINLSVVVQNNTTYSIIVNGVTYTINSSGSATASSILTQLSIALSANASLTTSINNGIMVVSSLNSFNIATTQNIQAQRITKSASASALVANSEVYEADTLKYLVNPNTAISVTNLAIFETGRALETDEELRNRFKNNTARGLSTVEAIRSKMLSTAGVESATVAENWTMNTMNDLPPKSFEVTVKGGSLNDVAKAVWDSKPAGIQPFGNTQAIVVDSEGRSQTVFFSRPINVYIHTQITYTLYSEEATPANIAEMIANAVLAYGESLDSGEDVIPQRIMQHIYNNVSGIENLVISLASTPLPNLPPSYNTTKIAIGRKEEAIFDLSRIFVTAG